jgi:predicted O-linked N-acetylglucosamine transferase (SPINDLY family)
VAASLLNACHLEELVCDSVDSYEATAIELLQDSPRLAALHAHLSDRRMDLPLFDSRRFTSDLEALYLRMVARQRAGLRPEHLLAQA